MKHLLSGILLFATTMASPQEPAGDLPYFQLHGPVRRIVIEGMQRSEALFDRSGRLQWMTSNGMPVTIHRNASGAIDSLTTRCGTIDGPHNTKYRQRATDERGNWMARKTQQLPYIIGTEYCHTEYFE